MTVSTITTRSETSGNESTTTFECGYRILADSDLLVYVDGTLKTINTHYTIANAGTTTNASVTFTSGNIPGSGTNNVVLVRNVPTTQVTDYQNNAALDAETLETSLDRTTMQIQQVKTLVSDRNLHFSDSASGVDSDATTLTQSVLDRTSKYLAFDNNGNITVSDGVDSIPPITSTSLATGHILTYNGSAYVNSNTINGQITVKGAFTVGENETGHDVKFFGATSGAYMLWDEDVDDLILAGAARAVIPEGQLVLGSTAITSTAAELNLLHSVSGLVQADLTKLAALNATAAELNLLGGATANTVVNSKAVVYGSSGELAGTLSTVAQTAITSVGTLTSLALSGNITLADDTSIGISDSDERIEFDGAGDISFLGANVGIGTAAPTAKLDVVDSSDNYIHLKSGAGEEAQITFYDATTAKWSIGKKTDNTFTIHNQIAASQALAISGDGKVGIGTSTASFCQLEVSAQGGANPTIGLIPNHTGNAGSRNWQMKTNRSSWGDCVFMVSSGNTSTPDDSVVFQMMSDTGCHVFGALSKGSGGFLIDHPLPSKKDTHNLVHSFVEGPRADLIYRGTVTLIGGSASIDLDTASGMTDGTWVLLCRDEQVFTSNETGWSNVKGLVSGSTLNIECEEANSTDTISWMVVAERHDEHMYDTKWTDENGRPIMEPEKEESPLLD